MSGTRSRVDRIGQIEALLLAHPEGLTQAEIARRLGVHRSTVLRCLPRLVERCFVYEDEGHLRIDRARQEVPLRLTLHEAMAVHLATRLLATRSDKHNPHSATALRKLGLALERLAPRVSRHLFRTAEVMDASGLRQDPRYLDVLEKLTLAWAEERKVRLWHRHGESGEVHQYIFSPYFVEPYAIGHTTHVIGWREPPSALRTLKLERIERVDLLSERYQIPADFDPSDLLADAWGIWYAENPPVEVVLRFHPSVSRRVQETQWHRSETVEQESDGSLVWRAKVAEPQEMVPWIRGWGADVEVLAPGWLRETLMGEAKAMAERYGWHVVPKSYGVPSSTVDDFYGEH